MAPTITQDAPSVPTITQGVPMVPTITQGVPMLPTFMIKDLLDMNPSDMEADPDDDATTLVLGQHPEIFVADNLPCMILAGKKVFGWFADQPSKDGMVMASLVCSESRNRRFKHFGHPRRFKSRGVEINLARCD